MNEVAVYIGRFQPFHNGHFKQVWHALYSRKYLHIIIGTTKEYIRTTKNPFYYDEIPPMIINSLSDSEIQRVTFDFVADRVTDKEWQYEIVDSVRHEYGRDSRVTLFGDSNDESSYYLNKFPGWNVIHRPNEVGFHAEDVRKVLFNDKYCINLQGIVKMVPEGVMEVLERWFKENMEDYMKLHYMFKDESKRNTVNS